MEMCVKHMSNISRNQRAKFLRELPILESVAVAIEFPLFGGGIEKYLALQVDVKQARPIFLDAYHPL